MPANPITPTIPLDAPGLHHGFLRLPHSRDDSAWGSVMIPLAVARGGDGPTALLTGANHGDEYEGPIALQSLLANLDLTRLRGRLIVLPYLNLPAFRAGRRTSPIDGVNLNRAFPGAPDGTVTQKIAHYLDSVLVPQADLVIDCHSGGRTLDFLPMACAHELDDAGLQARCLAAARAFDAPWTLVLREIDAVGMFDTAVEGQGKTFVTTELGGGGTATARSVAIARRGIERVLIHAGVLDGVLDAPGTRTLRMPDGDCYHFAPEAGLFEPLVDLGAEVVRGQALARIWPADRTGVAPVIVTARRAGLFVARHAPGLIQLGDCLAVLAVPDP
jgi:N2-acetyl-L-2,4-diaminobutanoate deacetylase